jgi:antitoxin component of MazEF toxin-antitoxin module
MQNTESTLVMTVPPAVLAALHISASDPVRWEVRGGEAVMKAAARKPSVDEVAGMLAPALKGKPIRWSDEDKSAEPRLDTSTVECLGSANSVSGVLCRSAVDGQYSFRVYDANHNFTDYLLIHDDLPVTISSDALASFYRAGGEQIPDYFLDHSPEVLGRSNVLR